MQLILDALTRNSIEIGRFCFALISDLLLWCAAAGTLRRHWSGATCEVQCSGHGAVNELTGECVCERGWLGDAQVTAAEANLNFDMRSSPGPLGAFKRRQCSPQ